jgi:hypothetical protein
MPADPRIEIAPAPPDARPPEERPATAREDRADLVSASLRAKLARRLCMALTPAMARIAGCPEDAIAGRLTDAVDAFFALWPQRPIQTNKGGMQFNDSLCLYVVARTLDPAFVLESGSFQGHSAWLLRQALPTAEIVSCDVDHGQLRYRADGVRFCERDWTQVALPDFDPARALAWFDDHIDHCRRLAEAQSRGFRHVLLDDNFPAENLYATGGPPIPTLAMALDPDLPDGAELVWRRRGKTYRYRFDKTHTLDVASRIEEIVSLPDLTSITRYNPPSGMTYVRLTSLQHGARAIDPTNDDAHTAGSSR